MRKLDFAAIVAKLSAYQNIYVAYSGGGDSHVLLHGLLQQACSRDRVRAVYINHNLSAQDRHVQTYCAEICHRWEVAYQSMTVDAHAYDGQSPEDAARLARYQALFSRLGPKDVLLTAHHQDDQAETLLLQLLRGAGLAGLAAMPVLSGALHRPLLPYTRSELRHYAGLHDLAWQEDGSNYNMSYGRNFLRHRVLPVLRERWPSFSQTLSRTARHCREAHFLLQDYIREDYLNVRGFKSGTLSIAKLLALSGEKQRYVLRYWFSDLHLPMPNTSVMKVLQMQLLHARDDACPCVRWKGAEVRRFRDALYAMSPLPNVPNNLDMTWAMQTPLQLPNDLGRLEAYTTQKEGGLRIRPDACVKVRLRRGGERFRLQRDTHRRPLKYYFQKWEVPMWQRERIPLIFVNEELACVVNYGVSEAYGAPSGKSSKYIECVPIS